MTNFKLKAGPKMFIFESFLSPNIRSGPPELKVLSPNFRSGPPELKVQRVNISARHGRGLCYTNISHVYFELVRGYVEV